MVFYFYRRTSPYSSFSENKLIVGLLGFSFSENVFISNLILKGIFVLHRVRGGEGFSFCFTSLRQLGVFRDGGAKGILLPDC